MKTDEKLGLEVQQFLIKHGVETPIKENGLSNQEKIEAIRDKFSDIMELLELDLSDDSLQDTPSRVAKMYVNEIFFG
jgi:GTP cyclohydrolase I